MTRRSGLLLLSFMVLTPLANARNVTPARAIEEITERQRALTALKNQVRTLEIRELDACTPKTLNSPANISGNLSALSCLDSVLGVYEDIYNLSGSAGQTVTIDYSSTAFEVFLFMEGVDVNNVSFLPGVSRSTITYTFPTTRTYKLEVEAFYGPSSASPHGGPYTLVVTGGGGGVPTGSCTANSTTMCLSNDRFAVSATWRSNDGNSGNGQAVRLTGDTGYFTFFSASNVEAVVKILNGCGLNSRYWVFAGGLTNVNVVITVRDAQTGTTKTYTNPINTAFLPIQDTNALATCP
jgi:hypothetical protein